MSRPFAFAFGISLASALLISTGSWLGGVATAQQKPNFDRLSADDRETLQKRFEKEIWPLLARNGKEGCIGCHKGGGIVSALRTSGDMAKDFRMLLRDGYFLVDDRGSLLSRIIDTDPKRRMPPRDLPRWSEEEIAALRAFMIDLEQKQQ